MTLQERLRSMAASVDGVSEGLAAELVDFLRQAADALDAAEARATLAENAAQSDRETSMRWQHRAEQAERERDKLLEYLHATTDEDGTHHPDWVARAQAAERERDKFEAEVHDLMGWHQKALDAERELAEAHAREQRLREQLLLVLDAVLACETRHDERGHAYLAVPARSLHDPAAEMAALREALRPTGGEAGGGERR